MNIPILRVRDDDGNIIPIPAIKGKDGKSAYEIAKENGYEGSEAEWAELLQKAIDSATERPKETKDFLNDYSYEADMDVSSATNNVLIIKAIADETNSFADKEIEKIEFSFDGGISWIDVIDFIQQDVFKPYTVNINKSFAYNDGSHDTICFGVLGFAFGMFDYANKIQLGNQHGFRVTYYTD